MRDYGKISPQFWTGKTGKAIKAGGPESVVIAVYLMSSPHSNMIGMYYLPMMYLALSYDHRIIDGKDSVQFLVDIKNQLENPGRMLFGL